METELANRLLREKRTLLMITLYGFGKNYGLPDISPFVTKVHVLLKMANLPYEVNYDGYKKAPKGKLPFIIHDRKTVCDSTFIRMYLEKELKIDFEKGLSKEDKAIAWAFEKMCEDHLYWSLLQNRWLDDANFKKGPASFFNSVPAPFRPIVFKMVKNQITKALKAQGLGRHSKEEMIELTKKDITSLSDFLGEKPFFMGNEMTCIDATVYAFVNSILNTYFSSPYLEHTNKLKNLSAYNDRITKMYFSE